MVVTALGIKREAKALTYNVQEIKAAGITKVKDANFINSLSGKVAGVTINQSSSGTGGSLSNLFIKYQILSNIRLLNTYISSPLI